MIDQATPDSTGALSDEENVLLQRVVSLNARIAAWIAAAVSAGIIWVATVALLLRGGSNVGVTLQILGTFFPGYSVTWGGAWVGALWAALYGWLCGWVMYESYARSLVSRVQRYLNSGYAVESMRVPTFVIQGHALGVAVGATFSLQLFLMTNWLVIRGTADQSEHAALLGQYLPGYSVSFMGSIAGAIGLFLICYALATLLGSIYNKLARRRRAIDQ